MQRHSRHWFLGFFPFLFAVLLCAAAPALAAAPGKGREIPVTVTSTLKAQGIASGWAETHTDDPLKVSVYLTFAKPFAGTIDLRGFSAAGTEAARSAKVPVNIADNAGKPVVFSFPPGTNLGKATRLIVAGEDGVPVPPKPQKRNESVGEEAKEILQELTR